MSFSEELLAITDTIAGALPLPVVKRIHIPPYRLRPGRECEFSAVQLADGSTGMAYTLLEDGLAQVQSALNDGMLIGQTPTQLARRFASSRMADRVLGLAAINAITRHLFRRAGFAPDYATNSFGSLDLGPGDHLGMVGYFGPLVQRCRDKGIALTVLELDDALVQDAGGIEVTLDPGRLAACNRIVSTSTVLLNGTLEAVLSQAAHAETFVIVGPSAGCVPDPLFARGVSTVGGAEVVDPEAFMNVCRTLEPWGESTRKYCISRGEGYPGFAALLERATRSPEREEHR
jgi:uncharacterized protein (DUF4213/DUF364 family)